MTPLLPFIPVFTPLSIMDGLLFKHFLEFPAAAAKIRRSPLFYDLAVFKIIDPVAQSAARKAVRDKNDRALFAYFHNAVKHPAFRNRVQRAGWFVQNRYFTLAGENSGDCNFLGFPSGKNRAAVIKFPGQYGIGFLGKGLNFFPNPSSL